MSALRPIPAYASAITPEFDRGEEVHWVGQPKQGFILRPSDAMMIPFSLLWCGFSIFWEAGVIRSGAPFFMRLWGVPFVLVGVYIVAGRFFYDRWNRSRTWYAVTGRRIVIVEQLLSRTITSMSLASIPELALTEHGDGTGTIRFGKALAARGRWGGRTRADESNRGEAPATVFERIEDGRSVYELIRQLQGEFASRA
jgi:hypothetical protein